MQSSIKRDIPKRELPKRELPKREFSSGNLSKRDIPERELPKREIQKRENSKEEYTKNFIFSKIKQISEPHKFESLTYFPLSDDGQKYTKKIYAIGKQIPITTRVLSGTEESFLKMTSIFSEYNKDDKDDIVLIGLRYYIMKDSDKKIVDSQLCITGKCKKQDQQPLDAIIDELHEEVGIIPFEDDKLELVCRVEVNNTNEKKKDNKVFVTSYIINIKDCRAATTLDQTRHKSKNDNRNEKVQVFIYGARKDAEDLLANVTSRAHSKDKISDVVLFDWESCKQWQNKVKDG